MEVSLYRGIQLYRSKKIKEALPFFTSAKKTSNSNISLRARYWEAEAQYQLGNHERVSCKFHAPQNSLKEQYQS